MKPQDLIKERNDYNKENDLLRFSFLDLFDFYEFTSILGSRNNKINFKIDLEDMVINASVSKITTTSAAFTLGDKKEKLDTLQFLDVLFCSLKPATQKKYKNYYVISTQSSTTNNELISLFFAKLRGQYSLFLKSTFLTNISVNAVGISTEVVDDTVLFNCVINYKKLIFTFNFGVHISDRYPASIADSPHSIFSSIFSHLTDEEKNDFKLLHDCYDSSDDMIILIIEIVLKEYGQTKEYKLKNIFGTRKSDYIGQLSLHFKHLNLLNKPIVFDEILPF
jgi:hypothetical protein